MQNIHSELLEYMCVYLEKIKLETTNKGNDNLLLFSFISVSTLETTISSRSLVKTVFPYEIAKQSHIKTNITRTFLRYLNTFFTLISANLSYLDLNSMILLFISHHYILTLYIVY